MTTTKLLPRKTAAPLGATGGSAQARRPPPRYPAISLTRYARAHVFTRRWAAGERLWHERDLFMRCLSKLERQAGREEHSHACTPVEPA